MAPLTPTEGLRREEYRGAQTIAVVSDVPSEFAALRSGCGIYRLDWRRCFLVSGRDRVRWLNGMLSNNIRDLPAGRGLYAFVLNPQGHILGDLYVFNRGEEFVLAIDAFQAEKLYPHLKRFIIMDQVEFKPADEWAALGVMGPQAEQILRAAGFEFPALEPLCLAATNLAGIPLTVARGDHPLSPNYEIWISSGDLASLWDALLHAGAVPVGAEAVELARVAAGLPRYGQDIRERDLPQETGQMRALSFTKGCYIGQEIVERIRARGKLHRAFTGFRIIEGPLPEPGAKVQVGGKEVGEITTVALLPAEGGEIAVALGYVRNEAGSVGSAVEIGATRAQIQALPFTIP